MSKRNLTDQKSPLNSGEWVTLGRLIKSAFIGTPDGERANRVLRTTYEKKQYSHVFPKSICRREPRTILHEDSRKADFKIRDTESARIFVRNLWFAHQFLPRPRDVVQFFTTTKSEDRAKMFGQRFEELKALAGTYDGWLKAAGRISSRAAKFNPLKTDLLATSQDTSGLAEATTQSLASPGSAAVADLIREVEQRSSYQSGSPDDACEKALYFLALGRPDIGEAIAKEVLAENPEHAVALYTNAVLLLDASDCHQKQSFIHDIMHPHDLIPVEAEEQWHADRHADESLRAWEKATRAFLLILKARRNWPERFAIKCYDLSPSMWQHRVDEWLFTQAASRIGANPSTLNLPSSADAESALKALPKIVAEIWSRGGKSIFWPTGAEFLRHFIIVAARVHSDVALDCLNKLEAALDHQKPEESELVWRDVGVVLPVSQEPTLAETLIPAVTSSRFCRAVFAVKPTADAAGLLRQITQFGLSNGRDRRIAVRSLSLRKVILNLVRGGGFAEAVELCREMAERNDWPTTTGTGRKLQTCWRYAVVRVLFESSRAAFEANDIQAATEHAVLALQQANDSFGTIVGEKPLLKFIESDEDGDTEIVGDFLFRQPNIITNTQLADFFPLGMPWSRFQPRHKACWDDFVNWSEGECSKDTPVLIAYSRWLARQHGGSEILLPKCEALAANLDSSRQR